MAAAVDSLKSKKDGGDPNKKKPPNMLVVDEPMHARVDNCVVLLHPYIMDTLNFSHGEAVLIKGKIKKRNTVCVVHCDDANCDKSKILMNKVVRSKLRVRLGGVVSLHQYTPNFEPDWAYLPGPVLCSIQDKLPELIDQIWFGAVCKQWKSVSQDHNYYAKAKQKQQKHYWSSIPMLMIPTEKHTRRLYSVLQGKISDIQLRLPHCKRFCGSSHGWLGMVDENYYVTLLNPFKNGITIRLPPIPEISKFILSADPASTPNDYVIVAIYSKYNQLAFIKAGDKYWRLLNNIVCDVVDAIFYKGLVYAVTNKGLIFCFNFKESESPNVTFLAHETDPLRNYKSGWTYLVESSGGDLFHVQSQYLFQLTNSFKVYKLYEQTETEKVMDRIEVKSLSGDTLFVGYNHSMSVSAANFPGCQPNSIYFTHGYFDIYSRSSKQLEDVGIFNVEDGTIRDHYTKNRLGNKMPPVLWIVPQ